jgi:hypothetical protein
LLSAIGIEKGKQFAPDDRMKKILTESAVVDNATARSIAYRTRLTDSFLYPDSAWGTPFVGGKLSLLTGRRPAARCTHLHVFHGHRNHTSYGCPKGWRWIGVRRRVCGCTEKALGRKSDIPFASATNIPAKTFWSLVLYDTQTRSMLQTDARFPSIGSQKKSVVTNPDTSVDVYFGPKAPAGKESNWVQTWPGKGWFVILRLYGPLQPFFDKTWRPSEIEEVK